MKEPFRNLIQVAARSSMRYASVPRSQAAHCEIVKGTQTLNLKLCSTKLLIYPFASTF